MIYPYQCDSCRQGFQVNRSIKDGPYRQQLCPHCKSPRVQRIYGHATTIVKGHRPCQTLTDPAKPGRNIAQGVRTPKQQEAVYRKVVADKRKQARAAQMTRKNTKRGHGEMRLIGSVPMEYYHAVTRETKNKNYWQEDAKEALKKHDLYLGDD